MIAACPRCSARYRIEPERLRAEGLRLRCSKCEAVFRVRPPVAAESEPTPEPVIQNEPVSSIPTPPTQSAPVEVPAASAPIQQQATPQTSPQHEEPDDSYTDADRARMVLIADPEVEVGKATATAVAGWGLIPILVHDGVEAMMSIQRMLPRVVVMDAALPKMFGFQVCEVIKRNESLSQMHVVLVGAIYNRERYRRSPTELYGADSYIERHELTDKLRPLLENVGMVIGGDGATALSEQPGLVPTPEPVATPQPPAVSEPVAEPQAAAVPQPIVELTPVAVPAPVVEPSPIVEPVAVVESPPVAEPALVTEPSVAAPISEPAPVPAAPVVSMSEARESTVDPDIANAERLARIVVSDIILYNQAKFDAAVRDGAVLEVMAADLAEGRSLFDARVDASVRGQRDFLSERLLEVARERGMS